MDNKTAIKVMLCEMVVKAEYVKTEGEIETLTSDIAERIVKLFATPAVSESVEPVREGTACPHFAECENGGKNKYCDLQTFKEIDCFVGQTGR